jgi:trans-aconitate 2-methyltransferase
MPWNPDVYNQFKENRYEPFYDLISHLKPHTAKNIIDLGCGTGELTAILAGRFPGSKTLGIDSSAEMLAKAPLTDTISFIQRSVEEQLMLDDKWDIIVANASLQWVEDHHSLFPAIMSKLGPGGQLAIQMPSQKENILNQLLYELVHEAPFYEVLKNDIRHSPVLSLDEYTTLLYGNGAKEVLVYQKVYPILAQSADTLYEFISGSALVPYMEKLQEPLRSLLVKEFKKRIEAKFPSAPMVYAFKRILLIAAF